MKDWLLWDVLKNKVDVAVADRQVKKADKVHAKLLKDYNEWLKEPITVQTTKELKYAMKQRYATIIVKGKLAEQIRVANKVKNKIDFMHEKSIQGMTTAKAVGSAGITEPIIIAAIVAISIIVCVAMFRDYDVDINLPTTMGPNSDVKLEVKKSKKEN